MKKFQIFGALLCALSTTPLAAVCEYPLDATPEQYSSTENTANTMFPVVNNQSVEYIVESTRTGSSTSIQNYIAASHNGIKSLINFEQGLSAAGDIPLPSSGIVGIEFIVDNFTATAVEDTILNLTYGFITSASESDGLTVAGIMLNSPGSYRNYQQWTSFFGVKDVNGEGTWTGDELIALPEPFPTDYRMGLYINVDTGGIGFTLNGADYGYVLDNNGNAFTIPQGATSILLAVSGFMYVSNENSPAIGTPIGGTLITDRNQFTQPFPEGTTDICGQGGQLILPNGKPFPGKAIPPGLLRLQPLQISKGKKR